MKVPAALCAAVRHLAAVGEAEPALAPDGQHALPAIRHLLAFHVNLGAPPEACSFPG